MEFSTSHFHVRVHDTKLLLQNKSSNFISLISESHKKISTNFHVLSLILFFIVIANDFLASRRCRQCYFYTHFSRYINRKWHVTLCINYIENNIKKTPSYLSTTHFFFLLFYEYELYSFFSLTFLQLNIHNEQKE